MPQSIALKGIEAFLRKQGVLLGVYLDIQKGWRRFDPKFCVDFFLFGSELSGLVDIALIVRKMSQVKSIKFRTYL